MSHWQKVKLSHKQGKRKQELQEHFGIKSKKVKETNFGIKSKEFEKKFSIKKDSKTKSKQKKKSK